MAQKGKMRMLRAVSFPTISLSSGTLVVANLAGDCLLSIFGCDRADLAKPIVYYYHG